MGPSGPFSLEGPLFRSRNASSKEFRWTTEPPSAGGAGSDSQYFLDPVYDDELRLNGTPPAAVAGERYVIPSDGTGAWSSIKGRLSEYNGSSWSTLAAGVNYQVGAQAHVIYENWVASFEQVGPTQSNGLDTDGNSYQFWVPDWIRDAFHSMVVEKVEDKDLTTPPASPANFARYIVGAGATGDWSGKDGMIALGVTRESTGQYEWIFRTPTEGLLTWIKDENKFYHYTAGGAWEVLGGNIGVDDLASIVITGLSSGDTLQYNGTNWVNTAAPAPGAHTLDSHSDVDTTGVGVGDVLTYDGTDWVAGAGGGAHALDGHTDTNLGSPGAPEDGYVVAWDNGTSKYVLQAPSAPGAHTLDSHSNVTITAVAANHKLRWNGSAWVNVLDNLDSLTDVVISSATVGDVLYYNGTNWVNSNLATLTAHNHTLDSLSNVSTGGKAVGDFLWWTGTAWANRGIRLDDLYDVSAPAPAAGNALVWNGSAWTPGSPSATVTAEWGYFYSSGGGFLTGGASGVTLSTAYTPNRFIVGSTGKWMIVVHTNASSPDVEISTSAGGVITPACTFGNTAIAALTSGQYFTISAGPNPVGSGYSISIHKLGS